MSTESTKSTRPKSRAKNAPLATPAKSVRIWVTAECAADIEKLRSTRSLNNRIAATPTVIHEAITEALRLETELMRANVNQIMKRAGGSSAKITG